MKNNPLPLSLTYAERSVIHTGELPPDTISAQILDLSGISQGWGCATAGHWWMDANKKLQIGGLEFPLGVSTHANSEWVILLDGRARRFAALVGVDSNITSQGADAMKGSAIFEAWGDGRCLAVTPSLRVGDAPMDFAIDLAGIRRLVLKVAGGENGTHYSHAAWVGALLALEPGTNVVRSHQLPATAPFDPIAPAPCRLRTGPPEIYPPLVVGASPGVPFVHRVGASGERPLRYGASELPTGLALDPATGVISGRMNFNGEKTAHLWVENAAGRAEAPLRFVAGERKLSLTPPMGWNSWNCWGMALDRDKVVAAMDCLISSGLADAGYQHLNIDDGWQSKTRSASGELLPHDDFGAIAPLADQVHAQGMKLGIYSSPGSVTCGGRPGSLHHETADARAWAAWGVDFLKHDWCGYALVTGPDPTREQCLVPFEHMRAELDATGRDIVYSLCQYGTQKVWEWGGSPKIGGNLWRIAGDITDTWNSVMLQVKVCIGIGQHAGPGHWNDPDMLVVGKVGWGTEQRWTGLTRSEQVSHFSIWAMLAAPLLIGCDLTSLDDFTLDLLGNPEVIAVDQDPLGIPAKRVHSIDVDFDPDGVVRSELALSGIEIWSRPLEGGALAVAVINVTGNPQSAEVTWSMLGLERTPRYVRNLWERKSLPVSGEGLNVSVCAHGTALFRIEPDA